MANERVVPLYCYSWDDIPLPIHFGPKPPRASSQPGKDFVSIGQHHCNVLTYIHERRKIFQVYVIKQSVLFLHGAASKRWWKDSGEHTCKVLRSGEIQESWGAYLGHNISRAGMAAQIMLVVFPVIFLLPPHSLLLRVRALCETPKLRRICFCLQS